MEWTVFRLCRVFSTFDSHSLCFSLNKHASNWLSYKITTRHNGNAKSERNNRYYINRKKITKFWNLQEDFDIFEYRFKLFSKVDSYKVVTHCKENTIYNFWKTEEFLDVVYVWSLSFLIIYVIFYCLNATRDVSTYVSSTCYHNIAIIYVIYMILYVSYFSFIYSFF